jgi:cytochrome c-type biogenesis protein CcmH
MMFWLILTAMTCAAALAVIWPLASSRIALRSGGDIAIYRDQLNELERDVAVGLIQEGEAEAARVEISRRLLNAADTVETLAATPPSHRDWRKLAVTLTSIVLLTAGSIGLYVRLGSPELAWASQPSEQRTAEAGPLAPSVAALIAKVESYLQKNPRDGRGWETLAPVYMQIGRYTDSANAWKNSIALLGETADRQANLGEALAAEANGIITSEAKGAFVRSVTLNKKSVSARYYLGTAAEQDGKPDEAAKIWRELVADAPAGAHWVADVRAALARVENNSSGPVAPKASEASAAQSLDQNVMIRGMVDGLAARLKQDGSNPDDWIKLVRSYKVLGELDKARAAIAEARQATASDTDKQQRFEAALNELEAGGVVSPAQTENSPVGPRQHSDEALPAMVRRLSDRLQKSGSDPDGWIMLVRSYVAMGETDKAAASIKNARAALADDQAKLQMLNEALQRFDIDQNSKTIEARVPKNAESRIGPQSEPANGMIRSMVARLADRLGKDGSDFDGWLQLVRSYVVLGDRNKAMEAAANARQSIAGNSEKQRRLDEFVKSLGLNE